MADTKLSALTALAVEPGDADELYVNDGGVSKRITYGTFKTALKKESLVIAASDETTVLTTGTAKVTFRMPYAFTLTEVRCSVTTATGAPSPEALLTVDINENPMASPEVVASILSTKLTIDAGERTSVTAATPAVISDSALADDSEMTIDIDVADGSSTGLKVYLIGTRT